MQREVEYALQVYGNGANRGLCKKNLMSYYGSGFSNNFHVNGCVKLRNSIQKFNLFFRSLAIPPYSEDHGSTVVKVVRYKSESRWFDSRWYHGIFH
jgi:hypothetical protein